MGKITNDAKKIQIKQDEKLQIWLKYIYENADSEDKDGLKDGLITLEELKAFEDLQEKVRIKQVYLK